MRPPSALTSSALPGALESARLPNGLDVHLLASRDAPVVTTALAYRTGGADDPLGKAGLAHFLEHMMFKGSAGYAAGQIDRTTRTLGGSNNAFTSQDLTIYHFSFDRRSWRWALDVEVDRMSSLTLEPEEVERERGVILEEIAMYEAEPWEALERAVRTAFYEEHPYSRPIAGTAAEVRAVTRGDLAEFHHRHYRPDNAVLVVAGGIGSEVLEEIAARFAPLGARGAEKPHLPPVPSLEGCRRLHLERGSVARLLFWLPVPRADHADFPALRLLAAALGVGRSSRLQGALVERTGDCAWLSVSLQETAVGGALQIAAELVPGGSIAAVEESLVAELERLRREEVAAVSLERARRLLAADWVFAHERVEEQAMTLAQISALVSPHYAASQLEAVERLDPGDLTAAAQRYLDPDRGSVIGWAEPRR